MDTLARKFGPGRRWLERRRRGWWGGGAGVAPGDTSQEGHRLGSILPIIQITMGAGLPVSDSHPATVTFTQSHNQGGGSGRGGEGGRICDGGGSSQVHEMCEYVREMN